MSFLMSSNVIIKEEQVTVTWQERVIRSNEGVSFFITPDIEDNVSSVSSTSRELTPIETKRSVTPSWVSYDNSLEQFDTSTDVNKTIEDLRQSNTEIDEIVKLEEIQEDDDDKENEQCINQLVVVDTSSNRLSNILPKLTMSINENDKKIKVKKELTEKLPNLKKVIPIKKKSKKKTKTHSTSGIKDDLPQVTIDVPDEHIVEEKPLSPIPKKEQKSRYEPSRSRLNSKPREPKYLEVDLGTNQPIFRIFLEVFITSY